MNRTETLYGAGSLTKALAGTSAAVIVTDGIPWGLHQHRFEGIRVHAVMPDSLDVAILDQVLPSLPPAAEVIGLGGGAVIDAAKYFAHRRDQTAMLIPTITSSNAPFSDFISVRREGTPVGMKVDDLSKRIVVDYALIRQADPRLNRAGFGDLLSIDTILEDWRIAAETVRTTVMDEDLARRLSDVVNEANASAAEIGRVTDQGIELLMKLFERSTSLIMSHTDKPVGAASEHLFAWNLEGVTGRHFLHGEIVALGIVISKHLQTGDTTGVRRALDAAKVGYHPDLLGIGWDEIRETLTSIRTYNEKIRRFHTVFDHVEWTPPVLAGIRDLFYS